MTTRRKRRKTKKKKGAGLGRLLEFLASGVLLLVLLVFGASMADRYVTGEVRLTPTGGGPGPVPAPAERVDTEEWRDLPTLDIRNGCGANGLAQWMRDRVHGVEFDVLDFRNADRYDYQKTLVRDRSGKDGAARALCDLLQDDFGVGELVVDRVEVPEADVVLVLGKDLADTLSRRGIELP